MKIHLIFSILFFIHFTNGANDRIQDLDDDIVVSNTFDKAEKMQRFMIDGRIVSSGLQLAADRTGEETPALLKDRVVTDWYEQRLDHLSDQSSETFNQRYHWNARYYKPGGPLFVNIGGEGPESANRLQTDGGIKMGEIMSNAQTFGAMVVSLEHRYYGQSLPFAKLTPTNLKYLSSRQALEDLAAFIDYFKSKHNMDKAPVVMWGGSYSGNLAAWFRLKHPEIAVGAIASSAPVQAQLDFPEYLEVVGADLRLNRQSCYDKAHDIFEYIQNLTQTSEGRKKIHDKINFCQRIDVESDDSKGVFYDVLIAPFMETAQYGGENTPSMVLMTVDKLCSFVEDTEEYPDPITRLVKALEWATPSEFEQKCIDVNFNDFVMELEGNVNSLPWFYQKCTEFGYFKTTNSKNQPFGSGISLKFRTDPCNEIFKITPDQIQENVKKTNQFYGGRKYQGNNVVFLNGSQDPWHALGIFENVPDDAPYKHIYINGTAHCADFMPPSRDDHSDLTGARKIVTQSIKEWLM